MAERDVWDFARRLRRLRQEAGLTQEALAARAKLHPGFVSTLERGVKGPSIVTLGQLAHGLGVSVAALVTSPEDARRADPTDREIERIVRLLRRHDAKTLRRIRKVVEAFEP